MVGAQPGFDDAEELRQKSRAMPDFARHIRILPGCPPAKVWRYLTAADLFAFPSHSEGMPNSLLEAMAVGVPAVAYAIPPILELDNKLGALEIVPVRDVAALARALIELASSPQRRRRISEKGRLRVLGHYQAQANMVEAMIRLNAMAERAAGTGSLRPPVAEHFFS
jgi:glycosyltransferase involved in cell wall biosynthesis